MKKEKKIEVTCLGVRIVYDDKLNAWVCKIAGYDQNYDSLASAKAAIAENRFKRFEAWYSEKNWSNGQSHIRRVTVTSVSLNKTGDIERYGISGASERNVNPRDLFRCDPDNDSLVALITEKETAAFELLEETASLREQLSRVGLDGGTSNAS